MNNFIALATMRIIFLINIYFSTTTYAIQSSEFFPFGEQHGDKFLPPNDDSSSPAVPIRSLFPFFNNQHHSLYVDTNGAISFLGTLSQYTPDPFPLNNARRIIAPFWADVDIRYGGNVSYRESTDPHLLSRASNEIHYIFPEQYRFEASWIFIATWFNVPFYGADTFGLMKRNTFQAVLITNGRHSFTIYMYDNIVWTTGTASGGDSTTGLGGTPAQVGFNAGNSVNYFAVNGSRTSAIINVDTLSNINVPGKFIFRIDTERIENGGCNTKGTLTISPRYGTMLGGQRIYIGGPCVTEGDRVSIKYGPTDEAYRCDRVNDFKVACVTPVFYKTGDIAIRLIVDRDQEAASSYIGIYTSLNVAKTSPMIYRINPSYWMDGQNVAVSWNKNKLPFEESFLRIDVFYLKELGRKLTWTHGGVLKSNVSIDSTKENFRIAAEFYVAALRLSPFVENDVWSIEGVWSDIFSVIPSNEAKSKKLCSDWYANDVTMTLKGNVDVQPCPCTLQQALLDTGRFHRDPMCNRFTTTENSRNINCLNQRHADHCIRLNFPGPGGYGRLCCYDHTSNLMDANGPKGGGTLHRYHYLGDVKGNIPYLSNFYYDIIPHLQCCMYIAREESNTDNFEGDLCRSFLKRRPASDCKTYEPPRPAMAHGDPHLITLDRLSYTFNGVGEFTFIQDVEKNFTAQVRLEQAVDDQGQKKKASVFTSIVLQTVNVTDKVEIQLNSIRTGDVLVNGELIDFSDTNWLDFKGISILLTEPNNATKDFTVMFSNPSISFQISASKYLLNIITVVADSKLKGKLEGLLGNFDGNAENDLRSRQGNVIPSNSSLKVIHKHFGETWRIEQNESLFTYPLGKSYSSYIVLNFTPRFDVPKIDDNSSAGICGTDADCMFDLITTGVKEIALATKLYSEEFKLMEDSAVEVISCGIPPKSQNGHWNYTGLTEGASAVLSCFDGYDLENMVIIDCGHDGTWSEVEADCAVKDAEGHGHLSKTELYGILGGIVAVALILVTCITINCYIKRKRQKIEIY